MADFQRGLWGASGYRVGNHQDIKHVDPVGPLGAGVEVLAVEAEIWQEQTREHVKPWLELLTIDVRKPQL